jgi:hypothetical protein
MAFSTASYLAGVGSVVVLLSTGFAGGFMLANPSHRDPPNRLQRLAAEGQDSRQVAPAAPTTKSQAVATPAPDRVVTASQPAAREAAARPATSPVSAKTSETAHNPAAQPNAEKTAAEKSSADRARMMEARAAERKRAEARRFAERQRKQRELAVATAAARRMIYDRGRDHEEFAAMDQPEPPQPGVPHLSLFGE